MDILKIKSLISQSAPSWDLTRGDLSMIKIPWVVVETEKDAGGEDG